MPQTNLCAEAKVAPLTVFKPKGKPLALLSFKVRRPALAVAPAMPSRWAPQSLASRRFGRADSEAQTSEERESARATLQKIIDARRAGQPTESKTAEVLPPPLPLPPLLLPLLHRRPFRMRSGWR